jgi:hypothetical protein
MKLAGALMLISLRFHRRCDRPITECALAPLLPAQYSPINAAGHGYQHVYLAGIPREMALLLAQLISPELLRIVRDTRIAEEPNIVGS